MFRALPCSSSGGLPRNMQPLVSSLSAGDCPVHRLRKNTKHVEDFNKCIIYINKQEFCAASWRSTKVTGIMFC